MTALPFLAASVDTAGIARAARQALQREVRTYPKPGLVSHVDNGAHDDMDCAMLERSAGTLEPWFALLAEAGAGGAPMARLRTIGIAAEDAMLAATGGVNTHRGAIFGMGLLCAAAGFRARYGVPMALGDIVAMRWGEEILAGPVPLHSHGAQAARKHGAGGARMEAAGGFPSLRRVALPALEEGMALARGDAEAARVHAIMRLIAVVVDTNILHRGGGEGLRFARAEARHFLAEGSVAIPGWAWHARCVHRAFVARRLSPGGCADLLAMALFVREMGG